MKTRKFSGNLGHSRHLGTNIFIPRQRCFKTSSRHRRLAKALNLLRNFATPFHSPPKHKKFPVAIMAQLNRYRLRGIER